MSQPLPLAGLRIVAVEQYGAGPWGTLYFSDLGAEVIKVENPAEGGEVGRSVGPHFFGPGDSHFFQTFNRNKKSIALDLKQRGRAARSATIWCAPRDGVFDNLRGDLPKARAHLRGAEGHPTRKSSARTFGLRPRRLARGLARLRLPDAGRGRPHVPDRRAGRAAGALRLVGGRSDDRTRAAFALLAASPARARAASAATWMCRCSISRCITSIIPRTWYLKPPGRSPAARARGGHPSLTPSQLYRTADGWIFIMCNKEKFWRVLATLLGKPEWADDPDFASYKARLRTEAGSHACSTKR
jgi:crotonobetainyl-CoA:carnitine CoA-transferase CaiB-like acyl-CoA transferase